MEWFGCVTQYGAVIQREIGRQALAGRGTRGKGVRIRAQEVRGQEEEDRQTEATAAFVGEIKTEAFGEPVAGWATIRLKQKAEEED